MKLNELIFFPKESELQLKSNYEKKLYREISVNCLRTFYLDDFILKRGNISSMQKYLEARNYLLKCGVIISVFDLDKDINFYSFEIRKRQNNPFDMFKPKGKLINITYQDYLFNIKINNETSQRKYITEEEAKQMWVENYNLWLSEYFPLIKFRF